MRPFEIALIDTGISRVTPKKVVKVQIDLDINFSPPRLCINFLFEYVRARPIEIPRDP